jgi:hypothetical protein
MQITQMPQMNADLFFSSVFVALTGHRKRKKQKSGRSGESASHRTCDHRTPAGRVQVSAFYFG